MSPAGHPHLPVSWWQDTPAWHPHRWAQEAPWVPGRQAGSRHAHGTRTHYHFSLVFKAPLLPVSFCCNFPRAHTHVCHTWLPSSRAHTHSGPSRGGNSYCGRSHSSAHSPLQRVPWNRLQTKHTSVGVQHTAVEREDRTFSDARLSNCTNYFGTQQVLWIQDFTLASLLLHRNVSKCSTDASWEKDTLVYFWFFLKTHQQALSETAGWHVQIILHVLWQSKTKEMLNKY